jgi:hypothetical protein
MSMGIAAIRGKINAAIGYGETAVVSIEAGEGGEGPSVE